MAGRKKRREDTQKILLMIIVVCIVALAMMRGYDMGYSDGYSDGYSKAKVRYIDLAKEAYQQAVEEYNRTYEWSMPNFMWLLEPISRKEYVIDTYNCRNFTAEAVTILRANHYQASPYCMETSDPNTYHAIVKLTLYIEPQSLRLVDPYENKIAMCGQDTWQTLEYYRGGMIR